MSLDITPHIPTGRQLIQGYGEGRFRIAEASYEGPVLVLPEATLAWAVAEIAAVTLDSLAPVMAAEPATEILLIGCGEAAVLLPAALRAALRDAGIVPEVMGTGAACRTFNVLLAEERRVAAALIPVD